LTTGRTGPDGRYRPGRKRRLNTVLLTLLAAVIAAGLLVALGERTISAKPTCVGQTSTAQVAVSSEIEPVVQRLAGFFNSQHRQVDGRCAAIAVHAAQAATVAKALAPGSQAKPQPRPDAWIPDSSLWLDVARGSEAAAKLVQPTGLVLARTPLVIAMPRPAAALTPVFGTSVGWEILLPQGAGGPSRALGLNVQFPDPTQSAAGLSGLIEIKRILGYGRVARGAMATFALNAQVVPPATPAGSLPSLETFARPSAGSEAAPLTLTSEQAVVAFDRSHPDEPLAVRYPSQGTFQLSYPYVLTTTNRVSLAVAKAFEGVLRSEYARSYVRYQGFRTSAGAAGTWPSSYGLTSTMPRLLTGPGPIQADKELRAWRVLGLGSRFLAINDVSAAMATPVAPGGPTLEQVLGRTSAAGMKRFPDSTQMGLWVFASHLSGALPYKQLVPMGPLPGQFGVVTRRQAIQRLAATGKTVPHAPAALYGTLLAAYKQMVASYQPQYVNDIIVLTAGVENDPSDISAATLLSNLRAMVNPRRPVEILMVVFGVPKNIGDLRQIAKVTNGRVWPITSAAQIPRIFYRAFGRRICQPHCPKGRPPLSGR
jgi:Bacterial extracellular solute-binding protein